MKKLKFLIVAAIVALTTAMVVVFSGCGSAAITGVYYKDGTVNTGTGESYLLELYSDGTYELSYRQSWHIGPDLGLTYGRWVTSYGAYEVTSEDTEMQTMNVHLSVPDRMTLVAFHRGATLVTADTSIWPAGDEANGVEPGISYTLYERAETETWATAEEFIAAYGKEYDMTCDGTSGAMVVELSSGYTQIPVDAAVPAAE